jgi:hypothetical protein
MAHKNTPNEVNYQDIVFEQVASTGIHGWVVQRAENSELTVQIRNELIISPDMIAGGYDINSGIKELVCCTGSQPHPAGSILAIAYNEVNVVFST